MDYKKEFLKNKITELSNSYKFVASMSAYAVKMSDFQTVVEQNKILHEIFDQIVSVVKRFCPKSIVEKVENLDIDGLPDYLKSLNNVVVYNKITSLKYSSMETDNPKERLLLDKMSVEYSPDEEIHYISIAKTLCQEGKYPEAIEVCEYIKTISDSSPVWEILGDIYRATKDYGKSVEAYTKYLKLNENDNEGEVKLKEVLDEVLADE